MGLFSSSKSSSSNTASQSSADNSQTGGAGNQTINVQDRSRLDMDQRSGYIEGRSSTGHVTGSDNLILGTGASYETTYVETLSDDVVFRALDTVDSNLAGALDFARSASVRADNAVTSAVDLADTVARRSAEYADAARLTLENVADPAGRASRITLYIVAGLAALALLFFRPRKTKA